MLSNKQICKILQDLTLCPNVTDFENNHDDYFDNEVIEMDIVSFDVQFSLRIQSSEF